MVDHFKKLIIESKLDVKVYLDVGANIGVFTQTIKDLFPDSQCHAFEPVKSIFKTLKSNLRPFDDVILNRVMVSDQTKRWDYLYIDPLIKSGMVETCTKYEKDPLRAEGEITRWKKQRTKSITLSDYIYDSDLLKIDLIKIDVEGYEFTVIKGLFDYLKNSDSKPFLYVEVGWGTNHPEWKTKCLPVYEKLFQLGYQSVHFSERTEDVLFVPVQSS